jgi:hypothetical protein
MSRKRFKPDDIPAGALPPHLRNEANSPINIRKKVAMNGLSIFMPHVIIVSFKQTVSGECPEIGDRNVFWVPRAISSEVECLDISVQSSERVPRFPHGYF